MPLTRPIEAIELLGGVLARLDEDAPPEAFHAHLCAAICDLTTLRRAVTFLYDVELRRVRAVGAHGVDIEPFRDVYVSPDTAPVARRALEQDEVVEADGEEVLPLLEPAFQPLIQDRRLICVPMSTEGRWVGVVLGEAPGPLTAEERGVLRALGKVVALAVVARVATRQVERARALQQRIDLAREVHDRVVQRLFGVSLALSGDVPLGGVEKQRCADELQQALTDLRDVVQQPLGRASRPTRSSFRDELRALSAAHADLGLRDVLEAEVPAEVEPVAQSVLAEAVRNVRKHAAPTAVVVRTRRDDGAFFLEVENDGVGGLERAPVPPGMGLRLAAFEALQCGGVLEFGARGDDRWLVRLVVPVA